MAPVQRFEDLIVWIKAKELAVMVDEACSRPPLSAQFALRDQMRRSAISIMSNIAEGFELRWPKQFRYFLRVAKGSAAELRAQLYLCADRGYLDQRNFEYIHQGTIEISRMLSALILHLDRNIKRQVG